MVAVDSGTWPTDGGGVATCRELVLDYVQHVRWSVLSEIGNDFKQVSFIYCCCFCVITLWWSIAVVLYVQCVMPACNFAIGQARRI